MKPGITILGAGLAARLRLCKIARALAAALCAAGPAAAPFPAAAAGKTAATASCGSGGPAVLATVSGFIDRAGQVRVAVYRAVEAEYLASGKTVARIDAPVPPEGPARLCVPLPAPGPHVVAVLHDRDRTGRMNPLRDGVGFAGNPRLGLGKPPLARVTVEVGGLLPADVVLNYLDGLRVRPLPAHRAQRRARQNPPARASRASGLDRCRGRRGLQARRARP